MSMTELSIVINVDKNFFTISNNKDTSILKIHQQSPWIEVLEDTTETNTLE